MLTKKKPVDGLLTSIDQKRNQMIKIAEVKGLNNQETVEKSRELDRLIVRYLKEQLCHT